MDSRLNFYRIKLVCVLTAKIPTVFFAFSFFVFYSLVLSLLGMSYIVIKGERLQTRRPRQFLGTGHMIFSQPLTRKTLRNFPF